MARLLIDFVSIMGASACGAQALSTQSELAHRTLATQEVEIEGEARVMRLDARERRAAHDARAMEHVFELRHARRSERDQEEAFQLGVTFPDIPTHDVATAPLPTRFGAVILEPTSQSLYVVVGKCSGGSTILRVYRIMVEGRADRSLKFDVPDTWIAQTERALTDGSGAPAGLRVELLARELRIHGHGPRADAPEWTLALDLETKAFRRSDENQ